MLDKTSAYLTGLEDYMKQVADQQHWPEPNFPGTLLGDAKKEVNLLRSMPEIVLLAGSSRFKQGFEDDAYRLSLEGCIVLGKHVFKPGVEWPVSEAQKDMIHAIQFRMCDLAVRVHIVNVDGYVGQDTYNLIRYAIRHEKPITFREDRVKLLSNSEYVTVHHFMQGTRRNVEFEEAAVGS